MTTNKHWTLDDIPWERFDLARVDPDILKVAKAAALVEFNADDYATYLCNVFGDDAEFQAASVVWSKEEVQHGQALGRWASLADPEFDFTAASDRFRSLYRINLEADASTRGSRAGELIARCMVETGTSSYYAALGEASDEPVLKAICQRIAADELRHYKLFYSHLKTYLEREDIGTLRRLRIAFGRIAETEDDELACAYYAANISPDQPYVHALLPRVHAPGLQLLSPPSSRPGAQHDLQGLRAAAADAAVPDVAAGRVVAVCQSGAPAAESRGLIFRACRAIGRPGTPLSSKHGIHDEPRSDPDRDSRGGAARSRTTVRRPGFGISGLSADRAGAERSVRRDRRPRRLAGR
jgi:hypothetical protein